MPLPFGFLSQISKCLARLMGFRRTVLQLVQVNRRVIFLVVLACSECGRALESHELDPCEGLLSSEFTQASQRLTLWHASHFHDTRCGMKNRRRPSASSPCTSEASKYTSQRLLSCCAWQKASQPRITPMRLRPTSPCISTATHRHVPHPHSQVLRMARPVCCLIHIPAWYSLIVSCSLG